MPLGMPGGRLPGEAARAGETHDPFYGLPERAEFLGEDQAGYEYWLEGGHIYADGDGHTSRVCSLAGWGRLRRLHAARALARGRALVV
jgi:hypothetical protein